MSKSSFQKDVWDTLSKLDVSKHIQKKMNLSYLSWAWAWGSLMDIYPESEYTFRHDEPIPEGGWEVWCDLTIKKGDQAITRSIFLPIMDYKNNSIMKPTARDLSDTRMRCLVKCMAMCGLGHYIYAGEDLPGNTAQPAPKKRVNRELVQQYLQGFLIAIQDDDKMSAAQLGHELKPLPEMDAVWQLLTTKQRSKLKEMMAGVPKE